MALINFLESCYNCYILPNRIPFDFFFVYISVATLACYWYNGDYIVRQIFATRVSRSERCVGNNDDGKKEKRRGKRSA